MICTPEELAELTNRVRPSAQVRALRFMGIEHRVRADGSVAVMRSHVEKVLDGGLAIAKIEEYEPDWSAM
jgi:hypothetical protein